MSAIYLFKMDTVRLSIIHLLKNVHLATEHLVCILWFLVEWGMVRDLPPGLYPILLYHPHLLYYFLFLLGVIKMTKFIIILVVFFSVLFCGINSLVQAAKAENILNNRHAQIECAVDGNCK